VEEAGSADALPAFCFCALRRNVRHGVKPDHTPPAFSCGTASVDDPLNVLRATSVATGLTVPWNGCFAPPPLSPVFVIVPTSAPVAAL
jgi:hypothetical protein